MYTEKCSLLFRKDWDYLNGLPRGDPFSNIIGNTKIGRDLRMPEGQTTKPTINARIQGTGMLDFGHASPYTHGFGPQSLTSLY